MNKDVIYIDVEDDITAIIGKVKDAKQKIVALVPPKRIGVLQSAVNLRLLARAATNSDKHLVLISNNASLMALAAAAKVPVAKNLQSKPEMASIAALEIDDGDDVIDGSQLPVGELVRTSDRPGDTAAYAANPAIDAVIGSDSIEDSTARATPPIAGQPLRKPQAKSGVKVPNFNTFRKKLVLIIGGVILLLALLIWAIFFAPRATVLITARTTDASVNNKVTFDNATNTNLETNVIRSAVQELKKDDSIEFEATGKKDVGDKATGQVKFSKQGLSATTVPAGTKLMTASGLTFVTVEAVSIPASTGPPTCFPSYCPGTVNANVAAELGGTKYNGATGNLTGAPDGASAAFSSTTEGGTDKTATVVTADDIQKATDALKQKNTDGVKSELKTQFGSTAIILDTSFKAVPANIVSTPAVDQELAAGAGKPKITANITYTITGVLKSEMQSYLDGYFESQLDDNQRIYSNGLNDANFTNVNAPADGKITANIVANAKVGPKINDEAIKETAKGKRYGDIQSSIEAIPGVESVDVKFSPFWVSSAPNDVKKIKVEFKLNE